MKSVTHRSAQTSSGLITSSGIRSVAFSIRRGGLQLSICHGCKRWGSSVRRSVCRSSRNTQNSLTARRRMPRCDGAKYVLSNHR